MKRFIIVFAIEFIATALCSRLQAQVSESVHTMFGIGDLIDDNLGMLRSLGGTGIAFRSDISMNYRNPGSYVWIPTNSIMVELGTYGIYSTSQNNTTKESYTDLNFSYGSFNMHLSDWWAMSLGVLPFSHVGYVTQSTSWISGERNTYRTVSRGYGGLHRIYLGHSLKILDNLSAGVNISHIGGSITEDQSSTGSNTLADNSRESIRSYSAFYLDYGIQYTMVREHTSYALGLVYGGTAKLPYTEQITLVSDQSTTPLAPEGHVETSIPAKFGIGLAVETSTTRVGLDFMWRNWSTEKISQRGVQSVDSRRYSVGGEYFPGTNVHRSRRISYRVGVSYLEPHLKLKNTPLHSLGVTVGLGMPMNVAYVNLALEYGRQGSLEKGLIMNTWWSVHLSVSFLEFFFPELPVE